MFSLICETISAGEYTLQSGKNKVIAKELENSE